MAPFHLVVIWSLKRDFPEGGSQGFKWTLAACELIFLH